VEGKTLSGTGRPGWRWGWPFWRVHYGASLSTELSRVYPFEGSKIQSLKHTIQPEIYDLESLKREYGRHVTFYGGISTQQFLPYASPAEVKELARKVRRIMGRDGGYILSSAAVLDDAKFENVRALIDSITDV
jgi:uroporphyrinogen decarboxylase